MTKSNDQRFSCGAKRFGNRVEIRLPEFKFAVELDSEQESHVRLANGITILFVRPSAELSSIRVSLLHKGRPGQSVVLRDEDERIVSINRLPRLRENCKRQRAVRRMSRYPEYLVHVSENAKIVRTSSQTAKAEFVNGVAKCAQGPEMGPGSLWVIYVRDSVSDHQLAVALLGNNFFWDLAEENCLLAMNAFVDFEAAKQIVELLSEESCANHEWIHSHGISGLEKLVKDLLAIYGPQLISNRLTGRAKDFLDCFEFGHKQWRANGADWNERLSEFKVTPWNYLKKYYRMRGVSSGAQIQLWISEPEDRKWEDERDFYDSVSDKFASTHVRDLSFLFANRTGASLQIAGEIESLVSEPLVDVVGWYDAPARIDWKNRRAASGDLSWADRTVEIRRIDPMSPESLTKVVDLPVCMAFLMSDVFEVGGDLRIVDVEQLWSRKQLAVLSKDSYRRNARFTVAKILVDGDAAGVIDDTRMVTHAGSSLRILACNGEGDHLVLEYQPETDRLCRMESEPIGEYGATATLTAVAPVAESVAKKPAVEYQLLFRGRRNWHTCSSQNRREHVFVQKL